MEIQEFINVQTEEAREIFSALHDKILKYDKLIDARVGSIMGVDSALVYDQDGVFKYGLTQTKNHYSFHSMVMYSYPELQEELKQRTKGLKYQKGCLNFKSLDQVNHSDFEKFIKESAQKDFSPVINHYKSKK